MPTITQTIYGPGGFDPSKKNNNVIEEREVEVPDLPLSPDDRIAQLESRLDAVAALAEKTDATARELAEAARAEQPPTRR